MPESKIDHSQIGRSVGLITLSAVGGHLVTLLLTPLLTRLFGAESFGYMASVVAWVSILATLATLRLELIVPAQQSSDEVRHLIFLAVGSTAVIVSIVLVIGLISDVMTEAVLVAMTVLSYTLFTFLRAVDVRHKNFGTIAAGRFLQAAGTVAAQLVLGFFYGFSGAALVLGTAVGYCLGSLPLGFGRRAPVPVQSAPARQKASATWTKNLNYALFGTPSALVTVMGAQAPAIILTQLFSTAVVGQFALATRILAAPMAIVGQAVGQVFMGHASESIRQNKPVSDVVIKFITLLARFGLPAFAAGFVCSPKLFPLIFGASWEQAGDIGSLLTLWLAQQFIWSPVSVGAQLLGRQRFMLGFTLVELAARLGSLMVGWYTGNPLHSIGAYAITGAISSTLFGVFLCRWSGVDFVEFLMGIKEPLFLACILLIMGSSLRHTGYWDLVAATVMVVPYYVRELRRKIAAGRL